MAWVPYVWFNCVRFNYASPVPNDISAVLGEYVTQVEVPSVNFVHKNENVFGFKSFHPLQLLLQLSHLSPSVNLFSHISTKSPTHATIRRISPST
jgi:hypothetical protein